MRTKLHLALGLSALLALAGAAGAQAPRSIRIGVLNDMSGLFADLSGKGSVVAAQMAAEDFAKEAGAGAPGVEILFADHQNKPDVGAAVTRRWVEQDGVAAVVDVPNSSVALAVNQILRDKDRAFLASSTATSDLTGKACAPTTVQWTFDTWSLANGTARALVREGADTWFFITADYSSFLLQAQVSGVKVIALANAGADTTNALKQAAEFGIGQDGRQRFAGLLVFLTDVDALGLDKGQGLLLTEAFYWDLNARTRSWSERFAARMGGQKPTMNHAGVYSSVLAYLRAARSLDAAGVTSAAGVPSGAAVVARMKVAPIDDELFGPTVIRKDGRA